MTGIDAHSVRPHGVLNLFVNSRARSLDAEDFGSLNDMIGFGQDAIDTFSAHHFSQAVAGDEELTLCLVLLLAGDDCAVDSRQALPIRTIANCTFAHTLT